MVQREPSGFFNSGYTMWAGDLECPTGKSEGAFLVQPDVDGL